MEAASKLIVATPSAKLMARHLKSGTYREGEDGLEKRCSRCQEYWPADSEFFYASRALADGLNSNCKACYIENRFPQGRKHHQRERE